MTHCWIQQKLLTNFSEKIIRFFSRNTGISWHIKVICVGMWSRFDIGGVELPCCIIYGVSWGSAEGLLGGPKFATLSYTSYKQPGDDKIENLAIYKGFHADWCSADIVQYRYYNNQQNNLSFLKGQCHEIFDPRFFFHQTIRPRALIRGLKPFRIWLRIRRENRVGNRQNGLLRSDRDRGSRLFLL
jgi:hypothetical protein